MIVLDARVLIAQFDANDALHAPAERFFDAVAAESFHVSPLTVAEVLVQPTRQGRADLIHGGLRGLGVSVVPLDDDAPARLAQLRVATRLKLPDCCVLLAAEQIRAKLATFDDDLAAAARQLGVALRPP